MNHAQYCSYLMQSFWTSKFNNTYDQVYFNFSTYNNKNCKIPLKQKIGTLGDIISEI